MSDPRMSCTACCADFTGKNFEHLGHVLTPPAIIMKEQDARPWRAFKARVDYDDPTPLEPLDRLCQYARATGNDERRFSHPVAGNHALNIGFLHRPHAMQILQILGIT
jgi:hypothetical protein